MNGFTLSIDAAGGNSGGPPPLLKDGSGDGASGPGLPECWTCGSAWQPVMDKVATAKSMTAWVESRRIDVAFLVLLKIRFTGVFALPVVIVIDVRISRTTAKVAMNTTEPAMPLWS